MKRLRFAAQAIVCAAVILLSGLVQDPAAAAPAFAGGKFELVPLFQACRPPKPGVKLCPRIVNGHQNYALRNTYSLRLADGTVLTAPAGMPTDLASIPRVVWPILPPDGPWGKAAGIHDDCYRTKGSFVWVWPHTPGQPGKTFVGLQGRPPLARAECDEALRQGMVALGVPVWQRLTIYEAVRLGGAQGWAR